MTSAKDRIRSTTPNTGFITGLLLWIPGFGSGKQNRSSMSRTDLVDNGNRKTAQNRIPPNTEQGKYGERTYIISKKLYPFVIITFMNKTLIARLI